MRPMARPIRLAVTPLALALAALSLPIGAGLALAQATDPGEAAAGGVPAAAVGVAALLGAVVLVLLARAAQGAGPSFLPGPQARAWMDVDVTKIVVAISPSASAFVAGELAKIPGLDGRGGPRRRREALARAVRLLRKCDAAWSEVGVDRVHAINPPQGEGSYRSAVREARVALGSAQAASKSPGSVLVTLVVAAHGGAVAAAEGGRASLHAHLDALEALAPSDLVAAEVIVGPPGASEPFATVGGLGPLAPAYDATLRACPSCGGPAWSILPTCPHCGLPAPSPEV